MGKEASKNIERRKLWGDHKRFFSGRGLDIGCGSDPYPGAETFDKKDGDAHDLSKFKDGSFQWIHSSHCLEHLEDPGKALQEWFRVLAPGGHMIITVPHVALYEHYQWPSQNNGDHKYWWSLEKLFDLVWNNLNNYRVMRIQINDENFDYSDKKTDQTGGPAQAEIEIIIGKPFDDFWADDFAERTMFRGGV